MNPQDLPDFMTGPSSWKGPAFAAQESWRHQLTDDEVMDVERAARSFLQHSDDISKMTRSQFALPLLGPRLRMIHDELINGSGVALLNALPVKEWPLQLSATAFFGIGLYLGLPRPQNAKGHVLGHVVDLGLDANDPNVRIYQTHERQTFHTDSSDIVGLLCLQQAKAGGDSALVSSNTIYNEIKRKHPALAAALFDPIATDRRGDIGAGQKPFFEIPVFNWHANLLSSIYQRQYIDSAQRFEDAMRLTPTHVEALDCFDTLANDPSLNFLMRLEPGSMQFVHNHSLLHDRTAFEDWADSRLRRHLLRLWISSPQARPLPEVFAQRYGTVVPGERGGVMVPLDQWHAPLTPV